MRVAALKLQILQNTSAAGFALHIPERLLSFFWENLMDAALSMSNPYGFVDSLWLLGV